MNVGYNFNFPLPTYAAPDKNEEPEVTLTWREGTELKPYPDIQIATDFEKQPYYILFSADSTEDIGRYKYDITLKFEKYGNLETTVYLTAEFTIVVTDIGRCENAKYKNKNKVWIYDLEEAFEIKNLPDNASCQSLTFSFTQSDGSELPEGFYSVKSTLYFQSDNPDVAGKYTFIAYMSNQAIGKRAFDEFEVDVKMSEAVQLAADDSFRLPPGEAPLDVSISDVTDDGTATIEASKEL